MRTVSVTDAKARLPALLREAEKGKTILICRDGKPVAKLSAVGTARPIDWDAGRRYMKERGIDWTKFEVPADFDIARGADGLE